MQLWFYQISGSKMDRTSERTFLLAFFSSNKEKICGKSGDNTH